MDNSRLPRNAYDMLWNLDSNGVTCWASHVRLVLFSHGFGFVWENQGVENPKAFTKVFKQRLIDCHMQDWHFHINSSPRFSVYKCFKSSMYLEPYFCTITNKHLREVLIRFRLGISDLRVHKFRYAEGTPDLSCPFCKSETENEMHFLFNCEHLQILRNKYLPATFSKRTDLDALESLLTNKELAYSTSRFIYYANKMR